MSDNLHHAISDHFFADSAARLQYQHEYTLAGLKTLIIINGGAIIGLLTYAGNASDKVDAARFESSFAGYAIGLGLAVFTYLTSYLSQAELMNASISEAYKQRGFAILEKGKHAPDYTKRGMRWVYAGIALAVASLGGFGIGSYYAKQAITARVDISPTSAAPVRNSMRQPEVRSKE